MPKKLRTNVTPTSTFQAMLVTPGALDPSALLPNERAQQRYAPKQSFTVHQRIVPQRVTSFASRRRNK